MEEIPYWWILEWFKNNQGGVLRTKIPILKTEGINDKIHTSYASVFAKLIGDKIYLATEKDIYDNGLHQFYNDLYKLGDKIEAKENYIYCYQYDEYTRGVTFYDFGGGNKKLFLNFQDMPWFSEDQMNRMIFERKIYECIK